MSTSLVLYELEDGPIVWRLDNLNDTTVDGIVDALFYAFADDPNRYNYAVKVFVGRDIYDMTYQDILELATATGQTIDELDAYITQFYTNPKHVNLTTFVLRPFLRPFRDDNHYRTASVKEPERYLQGVLTVAKYYDINIDEILARKPYKNGQYYDITEIVD